MVMADASVMSASARLASGSGAVREENSAEAAALGIPSLKSGYVAETLDWFMVLPRELIQVDGFVSSL